MKEALVAGFPRRFPPFTGLAPLQELANQERVMAVVWGVTADWAVGFRSLTVA